LRRVSGVGDREVVGVKTWVEKGEGLDKPVGVGVTVLNPPVGTTDDGISVDRASGVAGAAVQAALITANPTRVNPGKSPLKFDLFA
jgi:hypothetical protein